MVPKTVLFAALVAFMLAGTAYVAVTSPLPGATSTSVSNTRTSVTTSSSCSTSSGTNETTTTISSSDDNPIVGTFTYSPSSPIKVDSVTATIDQGQNGTQGVVFQVVYTNVGEFPVYVLGGCGSGLSASIAGSQTVLRRVTGGPLCDCAAIVLTLQTGDNHTATNPGCWSGYDYQLIGHGTVTMNMTLDWSTEEQGLESSNFTTIQAQFTF